jgi:hypothetical protein
MGSPKSVAQAASTPTRRQVRQSADPKRRSPRNLFVKFNGPRKILRPHILENAH